ncbi:ABC transporter permease [Pseudoalteromonas piscicida]|uniref:ABC transporter permease n=1 Tax=Pseudoalteromonas piscicida TaxID=43662 RepID=UPI002738F619|nr:ABC transporter permease [Pseudoalteromonas piscicida]MDP4489765.1 ABC transporter permease [Pseudoalteromonas piscicida]
MNHGIYLLKQAWEGLRESKGFLVAIVTTLGITLGALLCILTLAYVVILKPLPYPEQQKLFMVESVVVDKNRGKLANAYEYPSLIRLFDNQTVFSDTALVSFESGIVGSLPSQPSVTNAFVTPGWFSLLGVNSMTMGRVFEDTEKKDSYNAAAILSYELWQREFNGDSDILGQAITVDNTDYRVVGVLGKDFIEPGIRGVGEKTDVFLSWDYNRENQSDMRESFGSFARNLRFMGKLDSDLSISQVEQTLTGPFNSHWQENVTEISGLKDWSVKIELKPLKDVVLGDSKQTITLLLAGVVSLVLIAIANIANLFMSRTVEQQRELAIKAAVGASKRQIFQSLLTQSGLVVGVSVIVGVVIASLGFWFLQQYLAQSLPRVDELSINAFTLCSAFLVIVMLGGLFARISSGMINYSALNMTLQSSGKGTGIQVSQTVRQLLIISQVSLVILLVFISMVLLKDSLKVINQPLGFSTESVSTLTVKVNSANSLSEEERKSLMMELKKELLALPQVEDVSQSVLPLRGSRRITVGTDEEELSLVETKYIDDNYFQLIDQPLIEGDYFSEADFQDENKVIIINDVYANQLRANGSAQGSVIGTKLFTVVEWRTVIGVVKSAKMSTDSDVPVRAYIPSEESTPQFLIKLKPQQSLSREVIANTLQNVNRQFFVSVLEPLNAQRDRMLFSQYITAITSAVLAALTFFLAAIGLHGILSYTIQMRRFELGTRLAIGAKRGDIVSLIIKDNAISVIIGFVISVIAMLGLYLGFSDALTEYVNSQLFLVFFGTILLISIMVLFACYWPLRSIINNRPFRSLRGN